MCMTLEKSPSPLETLHTKVAKNTTVSYLRPAGTIFLMPVVVLEKNDLASILFPMI